jgi:hypothetical protein
MGAKGRSLRIECLLFSSSAPNVSLSRPEKRFSVPNRVEPAVARHLTKVFAHTDYYFDATSVLFDKSNNCSS